MADGDTAATFAGWVKVLDSDDLRLSYVGQNRAADLALKYGQLRLASASAVTASTGQGVGQRAVDTATGDEYRWNGSAWQLWSSVWKTWTPTYSGFTLGNGAVTTATYRYVDGTVFAYLAVSLGSTSAMTGPLLVSLPVAPVSQQSFTGKAHVTLGGTLRPAYPTLSALTAPQMQLRVLTVSGANVLGASVTSAIPATWGTGDNFEASVLYRIY